MKSLIYINPIHCKSPHLFPPFLLFHFPSLSRGNIKFLPNFLGSPKPRKFSSVKASPSVSYGGWDDLRFGGDWTNSGESTQLRDFLVSVGIDDKRHVFTFLLGIFCALAISRVRVSTIVVFPASVLVFAIGFSVGFVRGGSLNESSKRRTKEENLRLYGERLKSLVGFFDGFDSKVGNLRNEIQTAIDTREIDLIDLKRYLSVIESIKLSALDTRKVVEANVGSLGNSNGGEKPSSKKRKDIDEVGGIGWLQFVGGFFGDRLVDSKPNKVKEKDSVKQGFVDGVGNDQPEGKNYSPVVKESVPNVVDGGKNSRKFSQDSPNMDYVLQDSKKKTALDWDRERKIKIISENEKVGEKEMHGDSERFADNEEYYFQNNRSQFVNNRKVYWKMDQNSEFETMKSNRNRLDSVDFRVSLEHRQTETSFVQEQMFKKSSSAYRSPHNRKIDDNEIYSSQFREESINDDSRFANHHSKLGSEVGSSSSSAISDDVVFDRYLTEASNLLRQAKDCIRGKHDEEHAEIILYKSAKLLSKAITMKPTSLLAVGELGNTYLLHGELKLRISRELRSVLSRRDPLSVNIQYRILKDIDDHTLNRGKLVTALVNVCEECEELLVEAGRRYRLALSIDGNDVRALYNWGLALSFRAQLIADIGPEAAFDADQVYLAAIDKFDAMMSKGNVYAPDALFRWGVVLQHRSRLRPTNSKDKLKLLQQAKRLYEDALHMDSDNLQVKDALLSCISELDHSLF